MVRTTVVDVDPTRTPLIRWGAVVAGAVWGLAVMALLATLWLALAFPSGIDVIRDNLEWFIAASGAFSLFIAGVVAGALTDNRGPAAGWLHGMTAWGLLLIGALVFGVPSVFGLFSAGELRTIQGGPDRGRRERRDVGDILHPPRGGDLGWTGRHDGGRSRAFARHRRIEGAWRGERPDGSRS